MTARSTVRALAPLSDPIVRERARRLLLHVVLMVTLAGLGWAATAVAQDAKPSDAPPDELPELIVLLDDSAGSPTAEAVVEARRRGLPLPAGLADGNPTKARFLIEQRATGRAREALREEPDSPRARLERYFVLTYPPGTDVDAVRARIKRLPNVISVERNRLEQLAVNPSDPLFPQQWGLPALNLPTAWDLTPDFGHGYVGVIDTGIDVDHEDLRENRTQGSFGTGNFREHLSWDFTFNDSIVDEGEFQTPSSQCPAGTPNVVSAAGHGTHVAGIIGATTNNGLGVAGTCGNCALLIGKASQLRRLCSSSPCTVNNCTYRNDSLPRTAIIAAIQGLVDRGAQGLSMSFGSRINIPDCNQVNAYCDALAYANARDVVMAAASGNDGSPLVDFPALDPRVIAVGGIVQGGSFWGACDPALDTPDCPSNYGVEQELVAPARAVQSTFYLGLSYFGAGTACDDDNAGTGQRDGYGSCTGTSMSTPHVAGSATLLRSINPLLSKDQIRSLLIGRASQNGVHDNQMGYGIPNVRASAEDTLGRVAGSVLANRLTPLFSLYSPGAEDFLYTSVPQMAAAAYNDSVAFYQTTGPATPGYSQFPGVPPCQVSPCIPFTPGASVYVFTTAKPPAGLPPLAPLYRLTFRGPNAVTGNPSNRDTTYTTEPAGIQVFEGVGYKWDGIEGYIFAKCTPEPGCIPAGAVKLLRRYNTQRDDFAIFPENELPAMEAAGYTSLGGGNLSGYLGYVYRNLDADGDTLIDGFETVIGTNASLPDSDCDGLTDGHEVLNFPYGDPRGTPGCTPLNVQWIGQSVPTTMVAGQSYAVSLTLKNTGTQTWSPIGPTCNAFRLGSANPRDNFTWGFHRRELPSTVAPGGQVTVAFNVTAPATPNTYNFQWQMVHECVQWFGSTSPNVAVAVQALGSTDTVWVEDSLPAGAIPAGDWTWVSANPSPFSGSLSHQSNIVSGVHQHYFYGASATLSVNAGDVLVAYVYLDPANPPSEVMLQWYDGSWEHRAYWGANLIGWGVDGTVSRRYMGALPAAGQWVRLEVPASLVGLEGRTLNGMAFTLWGGRATWDHAGKAQAPPDVVWVEDSLPAGAIAVGDYETWTWVSANPSPFSGSLSHQSNVVSGWHQHYFYGASATLSVNAGNVLVAYVYLDPANPPSEVMLQWNDGSWEHRAYWGANLIGWGVDGTVSRRYMGALPAAGQWVRLEVPASLVGLEGRTLNGMAFTLWGGRATWDHAGKRQ